MQVGEPLAILAAVGAPARPPQPRFHLHLDADRDGRVDANWHGLGSWGWGRGRRGAIMLCNNDDDDSASARDNDDDRVNGGNDPSEIGPLVFRRIGPSPPPSWSGVIEVDPALASFIRIFDRRTAGGAEIIGPSAGATYNFPDLNWVEKVFGIEALRYAGAGFNGLVTIHFQILEGGHVIQSRRGVVRVAPWMMPNHLDRAVKVYVVNAGSRNSRFRGDLAPLISAAGCAVQEHASGDIWMQDCMEIGFASIPGRTAPVAVRAKRNRPLQSFPRTLLAPDFGYQEVAPLPGGSTFDSTGNLEVTPPIMSGMRRRRFPWGRIYYGAGRPGEPFDPDTAAFLREQRVQAPFEVDTAWLAVGHVDEVISFVPARGRGFKILLASPRHAMRILRRANRGSGSSRMLVGREFEDPATGAWVNVEVSIRDFLTTGLPALRLTASAIQAFNSSVALRMDGIRATFRREIGLRPAEIIEVPIIYMPNLDQPRFADAMTGGMVNMLVINRHCVIPKAFGPVVGTDLFERDLQRQLRALGLTVNFIDDWYEYHVNLGEVHCGTNTLRQRARPAKWWEYR